MNPIPLYKRVLLKVSGEALMGNREYGLDTDTVNAIAAGRRATWWPWASRSAWSSAAATSSAALPGAAGGMDRAQADYMGMLATVMNALAMQNALEKQEVPTRVQSAIPMSSVCEPYIRRRAMRHMEKGRVVIFAAGTGNPFFTTDTAAALRAAEMNCDAMLKGTQVDGVYSADPRKVSRCRALRGTHLSGRAGAGPQRHGRLRHFALARESSSHHRFQHSCPGGVRRCHAWRGALHPDHRTAGLRSNKNG